MVFLPSAARTALVWLLAVTSLVASAPRFDCVCPNGDRKVCFPGLFSRGAGCCCGNVCCPSSDRPADVTGDGAEHPKGCRACAGHTPQDADGSDSLFSAPCCKKTPAEARPLVEPPTKAAAGDDSTDGFSLLLTHPAFSALLPVPSFRPFSRQCYDLPPPPYLVLTLRHFII